MIRRVLVVDDEAPIRELMAEALSRSGCEVVTAASGEEALEQLRRGNLQVMLLDLKLPGMDGVELAKRIKRERPMAIMYAMTGYSSLFELADCREAGFDDYFLKPLRLEDITTAIDQAFEKLERWRRQ
jgi:CheY-like chemotaxis protein